MSARRIEEGGSKVHMISTSFLCFLSPGISGEWTPALMDTIPRLVDMNPVVGKLYDDESPVFDTAKS